MNPDNPNDLSSQDPLNFDDDVLFADEDRLNDDSDEPRGPSLSEIIHNNPSLKIFGVVLVIGIFLIVFLVFGGSDEQTPSIVGPPGTVSQPPGTAQLPPAYEEAVRTASEQRAVNAELTGGSALPTPIGTPERIEAPPEIENVDPLAEWRRAAENRAQERRQQVDIVEPTLPVAPVQIAEPPPPLIQQQAVQQPSAPPPLPTGPNEQDIAAMEQRFAQQMQTVIEAQVPYAFNLMTQGIPTGFEPVSEEQIAAEAQRQQAAMQAQAANTQNTPITIMPAGTVGYAQTLIEANSDVPGPVLAELASGPLTGARLIGSFQMVSNRYLTLRFSRAIYKGREYQIDAYALDPQTTLGAMATDVDRHYFSRIVIPAAARFLQGYAQAVAQRGTTVVVNNSSTIASQEPLDGKEQAIMGASEAINQVSQIVQQDLGNRPVTVKVAAGTRIGLLFISAVTTAPGQNNLGTAYGGVSPYAQYDNRAAQGAPSIYSATPANDPRIGVPQQQVATPPPAIPANNSMMVITPTGGN